MIRVEAGARCDYCMNGERREEETETETKEKRDRRVRDSRLRSGWPSTVPPFSIEGSRGDNEREIRGRRQFPIECETTCRLNSLLLQEDTEPFIYTNTHLLGEDKRCDAKEGEEGMARKA